jgi:hypothetical protein
MIVRKRKTLVCGVLGGATRPAWPCGAVNRPRQ